MGFRKSWPLKAFTIATGAEAPRTIHLLGRERWALETLAAAGARGVTPITDPAPRWSSYVHKLRAEGVAIETLTEPHGGPFAGTHGRYVLRSAVTPGNREGGAA